jgi:curved DNA binding protein
MADKNNAERTIAEDLVVTKYKMAGDIVNRVLKQILHMCIPGASVREICEYGDKLLIEETNKVFKKEKDLKKGIAFPTCISVNNCICHFSPITSEPDLCLQIEDIVKIDLGAHIDGFIAVVAHTIVVKSSPEVIVKGRKSDVILAAYNASQAALRLLKPGIETYVITETVGKICQTYNCKPIEGMLSHQLKQFTIDGDKTIIQLPSDAQKKEHEKCVMEMHEVYAMDVLVSTGDDINLN